jgi:hypothetical protein
MLDEVRWTEELLVSSDGLSTRSRLVEAQHHRESTELAANRIENKPKSFQRNRPEKRAIAFLAEDYRRSPLMAIQLKHRISDFALDFGSIRQSESLCGMRLHPQLSQNGFRYHRVNGAGIYEQAKLFRFSWIGGIGDNHFNVRQANVLRSLIMQTLETLHMPVNEGMRLTQLRLLCVGLKHRLGLEFQNVPFSLPY